MRVPVIAVAASLFVAAGAFAQSNAFIDGLASGKPVTLGQAAYLVLVASDNLGDDADPARAFELLETFGWAGKGSAAGDEISVARYSYLLMRAFGLKGGLMYSLFPGPRYAYRHMAAKLVVQGRSDPQARLNGTEALRMLGRVFDLKGISE